MCCTVGGRDQWRPEGRSHALCGIVVGDVYALESQCRDEGDVERVLKVCCCLHNVIRAAPAERRAQQGVTVKPDWRLVEEEELHMIYGDDFIDNARASPAVALGPGAVRSADMSMLRRKLVEHFKHHYTALRARDDVYAIVHAVVGARGRKSDLCTVLFL